MCRGVHGGVWRGRRVRGGVEVYREVYGGAQGGVWRCRCM